MDYLRKKKLDQSKPGHWRSQSSTLVTKQKKNVNVINNKRKTKKKPRQTNTDTETSYRLNVYENPNLWIHWIHLYPNLCMIFFSLKKIHSVPGKGSESIGWSLSNKKTLNKVKKKRKEEKMKN